MPAGDSAPAFDQTGYPLNGERLGAAWRKVWGKLETAHWVPTTEIVPIVVPNEISQRTLSVLLAIAVKRGILVKKTELKSSGRNRQRSYYRRIDMKTEKKS